MNDIPLKTAVIGIGGFAGAHHTALHGLDQAGKTRVVATCDPLADELKERCARHLFKERGIHIYRNFEDLLSGCGGDLDLVTVASPIGYHSEHHRRCVERGIACYLEKPPTLDPWELESMIALDSAASGFTQVGFNHIAQPWRQRLKERILSGEFGRLRRVAFKGLWSRPPAYYSRNSWAGKLMLDDFILLDSCFGNAMAHYVHNLLFHAGTEGVMSWAAPARVEAELYRANAIESADTMFVRGVLDNGMEFLLAGSHACEPTFSHTEILECEDARIEVPERGPGVIQKRNGEREEFEACAITVQENISGYCDYLRGLRPRPATMLRDCRPFVHLNALIYIAAGNIRTISSPYVVQKDAILEDEKALCISGIEKICGDFAQDGVFPSERGSPWASSGTDKRSVSAEDLDQLKPVLEILKQRGPF